MTHPPPTSAAADVREEPPFVIPPPALARFRSPLLRFICMGQRVSTGQGAKDKVVCVMTDALVVASVRGTLTKRVVWTRITEIHTQPCGEHTAVVVAYYRDTGETSHLCLRFREGGDAGKGLAVQLVRCVAFFCRPSLRIAEWSVESERVERTIGGARPNAALSALAGALRHPIDSASRREAIAQAQADLADQQREREWEREETRRDGVAATTPVDAETWRRRIARLYAVHCPERYDPAVVERALAAYAGREAELVEHLVRKYGPELPQGEAAVVPVAAASPQGEDAPWWLRRSLVLLFSLRAPEQLGRIEEIVLNTLPGEEAPTLARYERECGGPVPPDTATDADRDELRACLAAFYARHDASRIASLTSIVRKYVGAEATLFDAMERKYGERPTMHSARAATEAPRGAASGLRGGEIEEWGGADATGGAAARRATPATPLSALQPPISERDLAATQTVSLPPPTPPPIVEHSASDDGASEAGELSVLVVEDPLATARPRRPRPLSQPTGGDHVESRGAVESSSTEGEEASAQSGDNDVFSQLELSEDSDRFLPPPSASELAGASRVSICRGHHPTPEAEHGRSPCEVLCGDDGEPSKEFLAMGGDVASCQDRESADADAEATEQKQSLRGSRRRENKRAACAREAVGVLAELRSALLLMPALPDAARGFVEAMGTPLTTIRRRLAPVAQLPPAWVAVHIEDLLEQRCHGVCRRQRPHSPQARCRWRLLLHHIDESRYAESLIIATPRDAPHGAGLELPLADVLSLAVGGAPHPGRLLDLIDGGDRRGEPGSWSDADNVDSGNGDLRLTLTTAVLSVELRFADLRCAIEWYAHLHSVTSGAVEQPHQTRGGPASPWLDSDL